MNSTNPIHQTSFHLKSTFWLSVTAGSLIVPFAIYHLTHIHKGIGIGAVITTVSLYLVAWSCKKGIYKTIYTFVWLTPFTTLFVAYLTNKIGISGTYWAFSTVVLYYFMMSERQAWISNLVFALVNLPIVWNLLQTHEAIRFSVVFFLVSAYSVIFLHIITTQYIELSQQAITDKLTGLYNRTLLQDSLSQAINESKRSSIPFTIITIDIDYFKKINDELGHDVGDNVLIELGAFLRGFFRESDKVFRVGGEEFLVLIYNTDETKSIDIAEKMRRNIENLSLIADRKVTVSVGVAGLNSKKDVKYWTKLCDDSLYAAKNGGRNRVVASSTIQ